MQIITHMKSNELLKHFNVQTEKCSKEPQVKQNRQENTLSRKITLSRNLGYRTPDTECCG